MSFPKMARILIVICGISSLFVLSTADADSFLLTESDLEQFLDNEDHEEFGGNWFQVEDFDSKDQWNARPEIESINEFAFFFQIYKNEFNGGQDMTFRYSGQVDAQNKVLGLTPARIFSVSNVKGNNVTEICTKSQCNEKDNCPKYENAPWHGFNFRQKENSRDMEMRLSTTNRNFTIPDKAIQSGKFLLKLTKHNSIFANFLPEIGPDYFPFDDQPQNPSVVSKDVFSVKIDQMLRDAYFDNVRNGAFFKDQMGIWAMAADILPHIQNKLLDFVVIRSECSDMDSSFFLPSDADSMLPFCELEPIPLNENITLKKEMVSKIRGRMKGTNGFAIEFIKKQIDEDELKGIRLNVDGKGVATIQTCNDFHCFVKKAKWADVAEFKEHFNVNVDFILKIKKFNNHVEISSNCKEFVNYEIGDNIVYDEEYKFIVKVDIKIGIPPPVAAKSEKFLNSLLQPNMGKGGILIRKNMANWVKIINTLYKEMTVKGTSDKIFVREMVFHINKADMMVLMKTKNKNGGMDEAKNMPKIKEEFTDFELHVQLEPKGFAITFKRRNATEIPMDHQPRRVNMVKTSVTRAEVKDYMLLVTQKMPLLSKIKNFNNGKMVQTKGKNFSNQQKTKMINATNKIIKRSIRHLKRKKISKLNSAPPRRIQWSNLWLWTNSARIRKLFSAAMWAKLTLWSFTFIFCSLISRKYWMWQKKVCAEEEGDQN